MRTLYLIASIVLFATFSNGQVPDKNDPLKHPRLVNKNLVTSINGVAIDNYLTHPGIDIYSKMFSRGEFAVSDDEITLGFLDSVLTTNDETRPFYLFVFTQVVNLENGALIEFIRKDCLKFIEEYPCDFFNLSKRPEYKLDISEWAVFLGFELRDAMDFEKFTKRLGKTVNRDCSQNKIFIEKFTKEVEDNLQQ